MERPSKTRVSFPAHSVIGGETLASFVTSPGNQDESNRQAWFSALRSAFNKRSQLGDEKIHHNIAEIVKSAITHGLSKPELASYLESLGIKVILGNESSISETEVTDEDKKNILDDAEKFLVKNGYGDKESRTVMYLGEALETDPSIPSLESNRKLLPLEIGSRFDAHGISKQSYVEQLDSLLSFLTRGIGSTRRFYHRSLRYTENVENEQPGFEVPHTDGAFVIVGKPDQEITKSGIAGVIVNEQFYSAIPLLSTKFPNVKFIRSDQMQNGLEELLV